MKSAKECITGLIFVIRRGRLGTCRRCRHRRSCPGILDTFGITIFNSDGEITASRFCDEHKISVPQLVKFLEIHRDIVAYVASVDYEDKGECGDCNHA